MVVSGLYLLYTAILNESVHADAMLITGAVLLAMGSINSVTGAKLILWHRRMLKQSLQQAADQPLKTQKC
jgi:hypothetical protein